MFRPVKLLSVNVPSLTPVGFTNLPPLGMMPYQWSSVLSVTAQPHSSEQTTNPFFYDGYDVQVGDTIIVMGQGRILEIVSISSQDASSVDCVLEDVDSENAMTDPTQNLDGSVTPGDGYLFEVRDGFPIIYPLPDSLAASLPSYFATSVFGRYFNNRRYKQIEVYQAAHGFSVGDGIYLGSDGNYYKSQANVPATTKLIGYVTNVDVVDKFLYQPTGPYLGGITMPAGNPGSLVYLSASTAGGWTTTEPTDPALRIPAWIKIDNTTGVYIGGDNTPILGSQVAFDNTTANLPGSPKSVQAAIDALSSGSGMLYATGAGVTPVDTDVTAWPNTNKSGIVVCSTGRVFMAFKNATDVYYVELTGI